MANLCSYDLYATGKEEDLEKFALMMEWKEKPAVDGSMYCADMYSEKPTDNGDGTFTQHFSSATRWSVQHGMIDRADSNECVSLTTAAKMPDDSCEDAFPSDGDMVGGTGMLLRRAYRHQ